MADNELADLCPEEEIEWSDPVRLAGKLGFIVFTLYYIVTIGWWQVRKEHSRLAKRHFWLMVVSATGGWFQIIVTWAGPAVGRSNLPCDLFLWFVFMIFPLGAGALVVRLVLFRNSALYSQALQAEYDRGVTKIKPRNLVATPKAIIGEITGYSRLTRRPRRESTTSSLGTGLVSRLYLRQSNLYEFLVLLVFVMTGVGTIASKYTPDSPYGKGCSGCHISADELVQLSILVGVVAIGGAFMLIRTRGIPDPFEIIFELRVCCAVLAFATVSIVLTFVDPGGIREAGLFDYQWILSFFVLIFHGIQCPYQVYKTYTTSGNSRETVMTLGEVLDDPEGNILMQKYLATEFSAENLYFVNAVADFRDRCTEENATPTSKQRAAKLVYDSFIKTNAMLEVNISGSNKRKLGKVITSGNVEIDMFDDAESEIITILASDSFPRFQRSAMYKMWSNGVKLDSIPATKAAAEEVPGSQLSSPGQEL
eukprot:CAMPEP_0184511738 /NCGR_PEP_ID=MMETSP0198_2-20121128/2510_1 /TAXON_ID=1112570 /ORGANISM="Thraustochytrium sp., Strain LLF1b" /LENGTH=479 /DNA_ID=CAMNT_0026901721 /DNA_START=292 /DNA_END=1731 /DNA_ORIENTATION=+